MLENSLSKCFRTCRNESLQCNTAGAKTQGHPDQASWLNSGDYEVSPVVGNLDEHQSLPSFALAGARGSGSTGQDGTVPLSGSSRETMEGRGGRRKHGSFCFLLKMDLFVLREVIKTVAVWFVLNVKCFKIVRTVCARDGNGPLYHLVTEEIKTCMGLVF